MFPSLPSSSFASLPDLPLVVDLDGTLTPVDSLHELVATALLRRPLAFLSSLRHLPGNRAAFKCALADAFPGYPALLPFNERVLALIQADRTRRCVLCSAAPQQRVQAIGVRLDLFDEIHGSTPDRNLRGVGKARFLVERFGEKGFDYVGNDYTDLEVWRHAHAAHVISRDATLIERARQVCAHVEVYAPPKRHRWRDFLIALRPHQWSKNALVLTPLLAAHRHHEGDLLAKSIGAAALFCVLSSCVYLLNDTLDVMADRGHPTKRHRPFASGALSCLLGTPFFILGVTGALLTAFAVAPALAVVAGLYVAFATAYSLALKRIVGVDVATLAVLYTLRILAGSSVTGIQPSAWLTAFSMSTFISLALCKRYVELTQFPELDSGKGSGRGYRAGHARAVFVLGMAAMIAATLVLTCYLNRPAVIELYSRPLFLWGAVCAVAVWGAHLWRRARLNTLHDDPVFFALKDPMSWSCLGLLVASYWAAS